MAMKDLIRVETKPVLLSVNFEELKQYLATELQKYEILVTADTVKDAKALATELNATKRHMDAVLKEAIATASEPIKKVDNDRKELIAMCEEGRQNLLGQVKRFEDETRELARKLLNDYLHERWKELQVQDEFRKAAVDDLAIVSAVTGKGALAASGKRGVDDRVAADKALQDQTERRLLLLENQSLKAGLASPLTRDHVNSFLFQPDDVYQAQLDRIIASEIRREEEAERKLRDKIERERQEEERQRQLTEIAEQNKLQGQQVEALTAPDEQALKPGSEPEQSAPSPDRAQALDMRPAPAPPGLGQQPGAVTCFIVCSFELQVDPRAPEEVIRQKFMSKMRAAGFQSLVSVRVQKQRAAA